MTVGHDNQLRKLIDSLIPLYSVDSPEDEAANARVYKEIEEILKADGSLGAQFIEDFVSQHVPLDVWQKCIPHDSMWKSATGKCLLHYALSEDAPDDVVSALLTAESINIADSRGETALHVAIQTDNAPLVKKMLNLGADVSIVKPSAAHDVSDFHDDAKTALSKRAWPEPQDTCLNLALVSCATSEVPLLLLSANASLVNTPQGRQGNTPLHLAVARSDVGLVKALLEHGADTSLQRRDTGETALMQCLSMGDDVYTGMIRRKVLNPTLQQIRDLILDSICQQSDPESSLNVQDWDGWTALHICAVEDDAATCKRILSMGTDANLVNRDGNTPLHLAGRELWEHTFKVILPHSNHTLKNNQGKVPTEYWPEMYEPMLK